MMKHKLEDRILDKVYGIETRKTFWYILSRIALFALAVFVIYILSSVMFDIFSQQKSFDLINFWGDDVEVIKRYLVENVIVFFDETPKELLFVLVLAVAGFVFFVYKLIANFKTIINRVVSIYKFYKNKK